MQQNRDEKLEEQQNPMIQMESALANAEEEKITEKEDAIFDAREEILDAVLEQLQEGEAVFSEEEH